MPGDATRLSYERASTAVVNAGWGRNNYLLPDKVTLQDKAYSVPNLAYEVGLELADEHCEASLVGVLCAWTPKRQDTDPVKVSARPKAICGVCMIRNLAAGWMDGCLRLLLTMIRALTVLSLTSDHGLDSFPRLAVTHTCTHLHTLQGSCKGDSGGPLFATTGSLGSRRKVQVGVVSFVLGSCGNRGSPARYARVSQYLGWINTRANGWDNVASAAVVTQAMLPLTLHMSLAGATLEPGERTCPLCAGKTVWIKLAPTATTVHVVVSTMGSTAARDTILALYRGSALNDPPVIACDDGAANGFDAILGPVALEKNVAHWVQVRDLWCNLCCFLLVCRLCRVVCWL